MTASSSYSREFGKLVPPYPVVHCANIDCPEPALWRDGAYLYRDIEGGGLVTFCGDCSRYVELTAPQRFLLVPL